MHILIVDDDPQFVEIISFHLKKRGISFDVATTVTQVKTYTTRTRYDLILHDVFFPNKEDGLGSLKNIKANLNTQHIPVVLITSMPMELFQQEPNLSHYLDFAEKLISKDDDTNKIVDEVIRILSEKQAPPQSQVQ